MHFVCKQAAVCLADCRCRLGRPLCASSGGARCQTNRERTRPKGHPPHDLGKWFRGACLWLQAICPAAVHQRQLAGGIRHLEPGQLVGGLADFIQRRFHHHGGFHSATERDCDDRQSHDRQHRRPEFQQRELADHRRDHHHQLEQHRNWRHHPRRHQQQYEFDHWQFGRHADRPNLIIGSSAVTLTGGGTVTLGNNGANRIFGAVGTDVLTNANNIVQGSGNIGVDQMGLVNQTAGVIDANQATPLYIQTSNGTTNTGTLEATAGGNLILDGDTYTNTNGKILASGTGSVVTLLNPTINGGTLNAGAGASIQASGDPTLNGVTITTTGTGAYQVPNATNTTIEGTITNNGAIQLNATNSDTGLILGGASVTLTGTGTVTLGNNAGNLIYGAVATDVLTNATTIQGSGDIGFARMGLINQGTIDANQATTLYIQTSAGTTNSGTLEATAGGNLNLDGDTYTNSGTILATGANSVVTLQNPTINGGTLQTLLGGVISASGNPTLNGVTNTGTGSYQLPNAQTDDADGHHHQPWRYPTERDQ